MARCLFVSWRSVIVVQSVIASPAAAKNTVSHESSERRSFRFLGMTASLSAAIFDALQIAFVAVETRLALAAQLLRVRFVGGRGVRRERAVEQSLFVRREHRRRD